MELVYLRQNLSSMPFKPSFSVTEVPTSSAYFKVLDTTPNYVLPATPMGYGAPGGPVDVNELEEVRIFVQYTGEQPAEAGPALQEGDIEDGLKVSYALRDGLSNIILLYGVRCNNAEDAPPGTDSFSFEIVPDTDRKKLQVVVTGPLYTFTDYFTNVSHLKDLRTGNEVLPLLKIKSFNFTDGIIELFDSLPAPFTNELALGFNRYYTASVQVLIVNDGEGGIIKDISNMAIDNCGCGPAKSMELIERILLKLAAQTAFACGNYVKAHNAAVLLSNSYFNVKPCATC